MNIFSIQFIVASLFRDVIIYAAPGGSGGSTTCNGDRKSPVVAVLRTIDIGLITDLFLLSDSLLTDDDDDGGVHLHLATVTSLNNEVTGSGIRSRLDVWDAGAVMSRYCWPR